MTVHKPEDVAARGLDVPNVDLVVMTRQPVHLAKHDIGIEALGGAEPPYKAVT